jgi:Na+-transporting methylmalonyl-CoA/oxaloacetate decarboxylase gamma subunit
MVQVVGVVFVVLFVGLFVGAIRFLGGFVDKKKPETRWQANE